MNSCRKGKVGERECRDELRQAGFGKTKRGQQHAGGADSPDVICEDLPSIHWEAKRCESGSLYKWIDQATRDANGEKVPVVWHRKNHRKSVVILWAEDFLTILKETDRVVSVETTI